MKENNMQLFLEQLAKKMNPTVKLPEEIKQTLISYCLENTSKINTMSKSTASDILMIIHRFIERYFVKKDKETKMYRVGSIFCEALEHVESDVDIKYIPHHIDTTTLIEFPKLYTHNDLYFKTVILFHGITTQKSPSIAMVFPIYSQSGTITENANYLCIELNKSNLMEALQFSLEGTLLQVPLVLLKMVLKTLLYINSGDPDLQKEVVSIINTKKKKKIERMVKNMCPFSIINVGFNYKRNHRYTDSSFINTHLRWQPYGINRSRIKLIWVKEHERHYKKGE